MKELKIAISGKRTAGKDSTAECLKQDLEVNGYKVLLRKFATPVYENAYKLGMSRDAKLKDPKLMTTMSSICASIDPMWAYKAEMESLEWALAELDVEKVAIIYTDLRLAHEYDNLNEQGFNLIRLDVSRDSQIKRLRKCYGLEHSAKLEKTLDSHFETELDHHYFPCRINTDQLTARECANIIRDYVIDHPVEQFKGVTQSTIHHYIVFRNTGDAWWAEKRYTAKNKALKYARKQPRMINTSEVDANGNAIQKPSELAVVRFDSDHYHLDRVWKKKVFSDFTEAMMNMKKENSFKPIKLIYLC